jgi:hypothetical protein
MSKKKSTEVASGIDALASGTGAASSTLEEVFIVHPDYLAQPVDVPSERLVNFLRALSNKHHLNDTSFNSAFKRLTDAIMFSHPPLHTLLLHSMESGTDDYKQYYNAKYKIRPIFSAFGHVRAQLTLKLIILTWLADEQSSEPLKGIQPCTASPQYAHLAASGGDVPGTVLFRQLHKTLSDSANGTNFEAMVASHMFDSTDEKFSTLDSILTDLTVKLKAVSDTLPHDTLHPPAILTNALQLRISFLARAQSSPHLSKEARMHVADIITGDIPDLVIDTLTYDPTNTKTEAAINTALQNNLAQFARKDSAKGLIASGFHVCAHSNGVGRPKHVSDSPPTSHADSNVGKTANDSYIGKSAKELNMTTVQFSVGMALPVAEGGRGITKTLMGNTCPRPHQDQLCSNCGNLGHTRFYCSTPCIGSGLEHEDESLKARGITRRNAHHISSATSDSLAY